MSRLYGTVLSSSGGVPAVHKGAWVCCSSLGVVTCEGSELKGLVKFRLGNIKGEGTHREVGVVAVA
eukprot:10881777-Alexandrium_andersonii.AAC.1